MRVATATPVLVANGAGIAIVVGFVLFSCVMSSASAPPLHASDLSNSVPPISPPSGAVALEPSAVLVVAEVGPAVYMVRLAGSLLLHSHASLMAFTFFAHLLLNAMWFPLQLRSFSCVWPQRECFFAMHPTMLHIWVLVPCNSE